ncbi:ABC transporter ATP-binding protein [Elusimicrobiota bacterium]
MHVLQVRDLKKQYKTVEAVKGISFEVREGEIFALVGPNGAGKSTTLKIIATVLSATSGNVLIHDLNLSNNAEKIRRLISYLPEEAGAYKNLTGIGYLKFMGSVFYSDPQEQAQAISFAAQTTGLKSRLNDKVKTYSKGMTRKLLLARAIMTRPKLAILDEPTSGLDVINAFEIRNMLKTLTKEGTSILLSSHNMLEIEYLADRVGIINSGLILDTGTISELKTRHSGANLEECFLKIVS